MSNVLHEQMLKIIRYKAWFENRTFYQLLKFTQQIRNSAKVQENLSWYCELENRIQLEVKTCCYNLGLHFLERHLEKRESSYLYRQILGTD